MLMDSRYMLYHEVLAEKWLVEVQKIGLLASPWAAAELAAAKSKSPNSTQSDCKCFPHVP